MARGLFGNLSAAFGNAMGDAIGDAIGDALRPAVNDVGKSVAGNISARGQAVLTNAQTKKIDAQTQQIIANKKETKDIEYFDVCPYCAAPREGEVCEYCGTSLIKNQKTIRE